jgi:drug/metabolite transporter (DMT)-like permease
VTQERVLVEVVVDESVDNVVGTGIEPADQHHALDAGVIKGIPLAMTAVFCFAIMDTMAKYLGKFYPVLFLVWARYMVHMLIMLVWLAPSMKWDLVRTQQPWLQVLRGLFLVGSTCFFFQALRLMPMAEASAIGFIAPLLVTLLAVPILKEKISRRRWIAVIIGFIGVMIIIRPGGKVFSPAALLPAATALCFSLYQIITRKVHTENPRTSLFYSALVGSLALTIVLVASYLLDPFPLYAPTLWHSVLILALGAIGGMGHFVLIRALRKAPASVLAPFYYTQLVWIILFGYLAFGDFPDGWTLLGILVIVGSGLYVAYGERVHLRKITRPPSKLGY